MRYRLDINYTLTVLSEKKPFHHVASVELLMDVGESLVFVSPSNLFLKEPSGMTLSRSPSSSCVHVVLLRVRGHLQRQAPAVLPPLEAQRRPRPADA